MAAVAAESQYILRFSLSAVFDVFAMTEIGRLVLITRCVDLTEDLSFLSTIQNMRYVEVWFELSIVVVNSDPNHFVESGLSVGQLADRGFTEGVGAVSSGFSEDLC